MNPAEIYQVLPMEVLIPKLASVNWGVVTGIAGSLGVGVIARTQGSRFVPNVGQNELGLLTVGGRAKRDHTKNRLGSYIIPDDDSLISTFNSINMLFFNNTIEIDFNPEPHDDFYDTIKRPGYQWVKVPYYIDVAKVNTAKRTTGLEGTTVDGRGADNQRRIESSIVWQVAPEYEKSEDGQMQKIDYGEPYENILYRSMFEAAPSENPRNQKQREEALRYAVTEKALNALRKATIRLEDLSVADSSEVFQRVKAGCGDELFDTYGVALAGLNLKSTALTEQAALVRAANIRAEATRDAAKMVTDALGGRIIDLSDIPTMNSDVREGSPDSDSENVISFVEASKASKH